MSDSRKDLEPEPQVKCQGCEGEFLVTEMAKYEVRGGVKYALCTECATIPDHLELLLEKFKHIEDWADRLIEARRKTYLQGYKDALKEYAYWQDGEQLVGCGNLSLREAILHVSCGSACYPQQAGLSGPCRPEPACRCRAVRRAGRAAGSRK